MGVRTQSSDGYSISIEDDLEQQIGSISQMMSNLRTSFIMEDFDLVEEAIIARETKLMREIKRLSDENALLEERRSVANSRYEELLEETKKGMDIDDDKDENFALRRKNEELQEENMRLQGLLDGKCKKLEGGYSRLEGDTMKLMDESRRSSIKMERRGSGGMFVNASPYNHSGNGPMVTGAQSSPLRDHSSSKGNGDAHTSGLRESSPRDTIVIIDSDDDSACGESVQKKLAEKAKDNGSLSLTRVEKKPMELKRKRAGNTCSDDENDGDNFDQEFTPTSEMKLHLKSRLGPSTFPVNQCSYTIVASDINDPRSCGAVISRQDKENMGGEQKSQSFLRTLSEIGKDWDSSDSSTSTSSSSDSEDDELVQLVSQRLQEQNKKAD